MDRRTALARSLALLTLGIAGTAGPNVTWRDAAELEKLQGEPSRWIVRS